MNAAAVFGNVCIIKKILYITRVCAGERKRKYAKSDSLRGECEWSEENSNKKWFFKHLDEGHFEIENLCHEGSALVKRSGQYIFWCVAHLIIIFILILINRHI